MENMREILFFGFSGVMFLSALGVVLHRNPVKSAMFLVAFFIGLAAMYALIGATFLATVQILVYVGAIMVLFLFVIMLIAVRDENFESIGSHIGRVGLVVAVSAAFILQVAAMAVTGLAGKKIDTEKSYSQVIDHSKNLIAEGNAEVLSYELFSKYILPFELISIVLLVAVLGAVLLAKRNRRHQE